MVMLLMIIHTTHEALPCRVPLGRAVDRCFGKPPGSGNLPMPRPVCGVARGPFDGDPVSAEVGRARAFCASLCFQSHLWGVVIVCNLPRTCRGIYAAEAPGFAACCEETQIAVSCRKTILKQLGHTPRMAMRDDASGDRVNLRQTKEWLSITIGRQGVN